MWRGLSALLSLQIIYFEAAKTFYTKSLFAY